MQTPGPAGIHIELLSFAGCPNHLPAQDLIGEVVAELGVDARVDVIEITDEDAVRRERFLGSPTIRVQGTDIEPGAAACAGFALACRMYRSERGTQGVPDRAWLRAAIRAELGRD